jgi:hypothetical protein
MLDYLLQVYNSEKQMAEAFIKVAERYKAEPDIYYNCQSLGSLSFEHVRKIKPLIEKRSDRSKKSKEEPFYQSLFVEPGLSLLHDLHDLWLLTKKIEICWSDLLHTPNVSNDLELESAALKLNNETKSQTDWLSTRIKLADVQ